jgi:hypothetical protein
LVGADKVAENWFPNCRCLERAIARRDGAGQDEGNAYLRLGEVLTKLGREDEAREAYGAGIGQAEKFGHSGMAEDLRLARAQLGG